MARHRRVVGVLGTLTVILLAMTVAAGVPVTHVIPPLSTVAGIVVAPVGVVMVWRLLQIIGSMGSPELDVSHDIQPLSEERRAEAADTPRSVRTSEVSAALVPGGAVVGSVTGSFFEPAERFTA